MDRQIILISAYPKSGVTWLTRLLGDVLNCPTGASHSSEDHKEIAVEGQDRPGPYIIRKGHYRLDYLSSDLERAITTGHNPIPSPHILVPSRITNERLIFMVRDPRDIIVSACHHWRNKSQADIINLICNGGLARLPAWDEYIEQWSKIPNVKWTSYEVLSKNPLNEVQYLLAGFDYDKARIIPAIGRQSFENRKKHIKKDGDKLYLGKEYNLRFMRKGVVGDWKNHLSDDTLKLIKNCLGKTMRELGYE